MQFGVVVMGIGVVAFVSVTRPVEEPELDDRRSGCPSLDLHRYDDAPLVHITSSGAVTYRGEPTTFTGITKRLQAEPGFDRIAILRAHPTTDASLVNLATRAMKAASYEVGYSMPASE